MLPLTGRKERQFLKGSLNDPLLSARVRCVLLNREGKESEQAGACRCKKEHVFCVRSDASLVCLCVSVSRQDHRSAVVTARQCLTARCCGCCGGGGDDAAAAVQNPLFLPPESLSVCVGSEVRDGE